MEFLRSTKFWEAVIVAALIVFGVLVVRGYLKRLARGCCGGGGDAPVKRAKVSDKNKAHYPYQVLLTVDGMVCGGCAARIENALQELSGVWAKADAGKGQVYVRMKQPLELQVLRNTVNQIGPYTVLEITEVSGEG